jgi:hypothetical protein
LQVVELSGSVPSTQALTVYTPYFTEPDAAITPVTPLPPPPPPVLSEQQLHALVTIRGDNAEGSGFLMRTPEGTFVVTHLHLLAANPNVKIFSSSGAQITPLTLKGATDRDLALLSVQDQHFTYLSLEKDPNNPKTGDELIIPDAGIDDGALTGKSGIVAGFGPREIDFDIPLGHGAEGAPVIQVHGRNVVAIVTAAKKVDVSQTLAKAWPSNPAPGSAGIIPYFGLRLTDVKGWETYDWTRFEQETEFLKQFHLTTRCLDSFLNSHHRRQYDDSDPAPDPSGFYLNNAKLKDSLNDYKRYAFGADQNQRLEGAHELLSDLQTIANTDVDSLSGWTNLYAYDQTWAAEELAYRQAVRKELDDMSDNIIRFDNIARLR